MSTPTQINKIVKRLRDYRKSRRVRPSQLDQAAYQLETKSYLQRMTARQLATVEATHNQAVDEAAARNQPLCAA